MALRESSMAQAEEPCVIDNYGQPQDRLTFRILRLFFAPPFPPRRPVLSASQVATLLGAPENIVTSIMRSLKRADLLTEDRHYPGKYRYNYDCKHVDRQVGLEKILL